MIFRKSVIFIFVLSMILSTFLSGCSDRNPFEKGISVDAKVKAENETIVGKSARDGWQVLHPENSFYEDVELNMEVLSLEDSTELQNDGYEWKEQ